MAIAFFAGATPRAEAHTINDVRLVVRTTGKCLGVQGGSTAQGALLEQQSCTGALSQRWDIVHYGSSHYFRNDNSGKCLDVPSESMNDGVQLWQWQCNQMGAQLFSAPACALCWSDMKRAANTTKCVDLQYSQIGDGVPIQQWTCNSTRAQQWTPDSHAFEKPVLTERWYQFYEDTYNYTSWMTLRTYRSVPSQYAANWTGPFNGGIGDWNNGAWSFNTTYLAEYSYPSVLDDVHLAVSGGAPACYSYNGIEVCSSELAATGLFDEGKHLCPAYAGGDCDPNHPPKTNTYWYAWAVMNNDKHVGTYGTAIQRQASVAHEIGHVLNLAEDQGGPGCQLTLMDYACLNAATSQNNYYRPFPKDSCGINHAYYDPNWGWSGC